MSAVSIYEKTLINHIDGVENSRPIVGPCVENFLWYLNGLLYNAKYDAHTQLREAVGYLKKTLAGFDNYNFLDDPVVERKECCGVKYTSDVKSNGTTITIISICVIMYRHNTHYVRLEQELMNPSKLMIHAALPKQ